MAEFRLFKVKETGELVQYPAHFANHPVFGANLELADAECEVDKVVTETPELPVEQRIGKYVKADKPETTNKKEKK